MISGAGKPAMINKRPASSTQNLLGSIPLGLARRNCSSGVGWGCILSQQLSLLVCKSLPHDAGFGNMKVEGFKRPWREVEVRFDSTIKVGVPEEALAYGRWHNSGLITKDSSRCGVEPSWAREPSVVCHGCQSWRSGTAWACGAQNTMSEF